MRKLGAGDVGVWGYAGRRTVGVGGSEVVGHQPSTMAHNPEHCVLCGIRGSVWTRPWSGLLCISARRRLLLSSWGQDRAERLRPTVPCIKVLSGAVPPHIISQGQLLIEY